MLYVIALAALVLAIIQAYRSITGYLRDQDHQRRKRRHDQEHARIVKAWDEKRPRVQPGEGGIQQ